MDPQWIAVGLANSRIHLFDAKTGLFAFTLEGHESGVWSVNLVSKTDLQDEDAGEEAPRSTSSDLTPVLSNLKKEPIDLSLVYQDTRESASAFSWRTNSQSPDKKVNPSQSSNSEEAQALIYWFFKARELLFGKDKPERNGSQVSSVEEMTAELEAGSIRESVMEDGGGRIPNQLAHFSESGADLSDSEELNFCNSSLYAKAFGEGSYQEDSAQSSTSFSNDGDSLNSLTGSSKGFGNRHALLVSGSCDRTVRVWDLRTG